MGNDNNKISEFNMTHRLITDKGIALVLLFSGCVVSCVENNSNTRGYYFEKEDDIDKIINKYKHFKLPVDARRFIEHHENFAKMDFKEKETI